MFIVKWPEGIDQKVPPFVLIQLYEHNSTDAFMFASDR